MEGFLNTNINTNTKESEMLKWALESAEESFCTEQGAQARGGNQYDRIHNVNEKYGYSIIASEEVIGDIIYRLEEQLPEMKGAAIESEKEVKSDLNAARRVVKKLQNIKEKYEDKGII